MQRGGLWDGQPRSFFDEQVRRQVESGIPADAAKRYLNALQYGGVTEAEAWGIMKGRTHNPAGHSHELIEFSDLPPRWFRNAWVRGHNGGPPRVDLHRAKPIQWRRIVDAKDLENQRRERDLDDVLGPVRLDELSLKSAIRRARDEEELMRVWPEGLPFKA